MKTDNLIAKTLCDLNPVDSNENNQIEKTVKNNIDKSESLIGKTFGNYKIHSKIGEGGMGVVYLGENEFLGTKVAMKSIASELTNQKDSLFRFEQEAKTQANLNHINIVRVIDFINVNNTFFLIMEYVEGQDIENIIKNKGKLTEEEALPIMKEALHGLAYIHSNKIIHRDIKPSNIKRDTNGIIKIMDFGIALMTEYPAIDRKTIVNSTLGSIHYMSPEQIIDPRKIDYRSDIYSMGIVFYELLTGQIPFSGDTEFIISQKHIKEYPEEINEIAHGISSELSSIIMKALNKDPDDRYLDCNDFLEEIKKYEENSSEIELDDEVIPIIKPIIKKSSKPKKNIPLKTIISVIAILIFAYISPDIYKILTPPINHVEKCKNNSDIDSIVIQTITKGVLLSETLQKLDILNKNYEIAKAIGQKDICEDYQNKIKDLEKIIKKEFLEYKKLINTLKECAEKSENTLNKQISILPEKNSDKKHKVILTIKKHLMENPQNINKWRNDFNINIKI